MTIPSSGAHVLVFPYPAQGHMIPLLDLTHHLATRGLTITILVTPKNLSLLSPLLSRHSPSTVCPLVLNFPKYPSLPFGVENAKDLSAPQFPLFIHALGSLYAPLLEWFSNHPSPPVVIISDIFLGWTHRLGKQLGVPRVAFSPCGAMSLSIMYSLWRGLLRPRDGEGSVKLPDIPNSPIYPWSELSPLYRTYVEGDPVSEFLRGEVFLGNIASWGLVVNTFTELERVYLDHLKEVMGHDKVWAVGPLLPPFDGNRASPIERGGPTSELASDMMSWLDTCEDHSVVYVCFGSQVVLTNKQMDELALGLERSGAKFIWYVKDPTKGHMEEHYSVVPPGFEDRTAERGRVIRGWAPQVSILSHRAVGLHMTHCGWNSMLESIFAGVPMVVWPTMADQFVNATLLDELGVAVRVFKGAEAVLDSDELARVFSEMVCEGRVETIKAMKLHNAALVAIKRGGTSYNEMDGLIRSLTNLNIEFRVKCH